MKKAIWAALKAMLIHTEGKENGEAIFARLKEYSEKYTARRTELYFEGLELKKFKSGETRKITIYLDQRLREEGFTPPIRGE